MSNVVDEITQNVQDALLGLGQFADVALGPRSASAGLPRAHLRVLGLQTRPADDGATTWGQLRLEVGIVTSGSTHAEALDRATDLLQRSRDALDADPFRAGLASHLPWGRATEFGPARWDFSARPPLCELSFELICHYEA